MSSITILYNKSNTFGLQQDSSALRRILEMRGFQVREADPLEPVAPCAIAIHLEVPIYSAMALASYNVFVINPEWWSEAWNSYLPKADLLIFKCTADKETFLNLLPEELRAIHAEAAVFPWTTVNQKTVKEPQSMNQSDGCAWFLGGSVSKRAAAEVIIPLWLPTWPKLDVYTTQPLNVVLSEDNVQIHVKDLSENSRRQIQHFKPCHLIFSRSEALGLVGLEGQASGAFLIGNMLPSYVEAYEGNPHVALIPASLEPYNAGQRDTFASITVDSLQKGIDAFMAADMTVVRREQKAAAFKRNEDFVLQISALFAKPSVSTAPSGTPSSPIQRMLSDAELPSISVVTLLYNRRKFVDLALHNLLVTDYPKDKIEWVVVEDSDITEEQAADKVIKFGRESAPLSVSYIPVPSTKKIRNTIGMKRNTGISRAQNDIILFMDDDDHYPPSSFRRRVSTLLTHSWKPKAAACTTIACYDLLKGMSAVNTPPWDLPLRKRISEATLVFYKNWWEAKGFPEVSVAEGEGFLEGREGDVLELPPQQMIVAMSHKTNSTSRKFPDGRPSCFWGFPKEFLKWLHGLVDVEIE